MSDQLARIPPQATEVEESVLGSMMLEEEALDLALIHLKADDFYKPAHRMIYQAMAELRNRNQPCDLLSIESRLKDREEIEQVGGQGYIAGLTRSVSSALNIEYHAQIIREKSIKRQVIQHCHKVVEMCYDPGSDTYEVVDKAQAAMFSVTDSSGGHMHKLSETLERVAIRVQEIQESGQPIGLRTGLDIDKILQGFQKKKVYFIGSRPSMGKTALVMTIMRRLARDQHNSGILSMETSDESLATRLITQVSELQVDTIGSGKMNESQLAAFFDAINQLYEYGIYIDDEPSMSVQKVRAKCRLMKKKGVEIIFIDFLQLMNGEGHNKHQEIGDITKGLKRIAKELDMPIVALSQLNRKVEERSDKRPQMADLRESGSIEEDADVIMFLYRPEYYGITTTAEGQATEGLCEVIIAKNKDGKTGMQSLRFLDKYMRFENFSNNPQYQGPTVKPFYEPQIDNGFDDETTF